MLEYFEKVLSQRTAKVAYSASHKSIIQSLKIIGMYGVYPCHEHCKRIV